MRTIQNLLDVSPGGCPPSDAFDAHNSGNGTGSDASPETAKRQSLLQPAPTGDILDDLAPDDDEADLARQVAAKMQRHRSKRMRLQLAGKKA